MHWLRLVCSVMLATLSLASVGDDAAARPATIHLPWPNSWIGIRTDPCSGVLARCSIGSATAAEQSTLVWAGVGGTRLLDVVQIGTKVTPSGVRFFAAYGCGSPEASGSLYVERDLGPADRLFHKFTVQLIGDAWSLSVDGRTRLVVPDTFRTWSIRSTQVMHENEGAADELGGTRSNPVRCSESHVFVNGWTHATWSFGGYGPKAMATRSRFGPDWFEVWR